MDSYTDSNSLLQWIEQQYTWDTNISVVGYEVLRLSAQEWKSLVIW